MEISKVLELSTAHVSEKTAKMLDEEAETFSPEFPLVIYSKGEFGWYVVVPEDEEDREQAKELLPEDLVVVMNFAIEQDCKWIFFDRDVEPSIELPCYEW